MAFAKKSYRTSAADFVVWWGGGSATILQLKKALVRKHVLPFSMVFAEFCGGVTGIFGEYSRSVKRLAAVRKQFV
jgi:hypothetical protein